MNLVHEIGGLFNMSQEGSCGVYTIYIYTYICIYIHIYIYTHLLSKDEQDIMKLSGFAMVISRAA